jgi:lysyl-tRNA synthetase class II
MALADAELRHGLARIGGAEHVATLSRPKVLDEMFQAFVESKIDTPTFVVDYPEGAVARWPSRSAEIRTRSRSGSNCLRVARSWRTPSAS